MPCALCVKKGRDCILDHGMRACRGCNSSHLGCSLVAVPMPAQPNKAGGSKDMEKEEPRSSKQTPGSIPRRPQRTRPPPRDAVKGKERPRIPMMSVRPPVRKRVVEETKESSGSEIEEVTPPPKKPKTRHAPSVPGGEANGGMEAAVAGMKVAAGAMIGQAGALIGQAGTMIGQAESLLATARLLDQSVGELERAVKQRK